MKMWFVKYVNMANHISFLSNTQQITDLMGPRKIPSYSGYYSEMVLEDDYSGYIWVYFLKEKSEILTEFVEF